MAKSKTKRAQSKTIVETPVEQPKATRVFNWKIYLVFTLISFLFYANTLNHSYALDDEIVLTRNKFTQQGFGGIGDIFKYDTFVGHVATFAGNEQKTGEQLQNEMIFVAGGRYRPLSLATFAMEVDLFGKKQFQPYSNQEFIGNPFMSHLINILLYLCTACLLYIILQRLFPPKKDGKWYLSFPFIVTLLYLAHPLHTEAVANIKGRDEIMTLLGALGALWFTLKYLDDKRKVNLLLSGVSMFLGLLSKENAITFLAVIPVTVYYFVDKNIRKNLTACIPLFVAAIVFLIIRGSILGASNSDAVATDLMNNSFIGLSAGEKFATVFYTLGLYIKLLFFPHPLTYDYYPYHIEITGWSNPFVLFSLALYLFMGGYAVYGLIKKRDVISYSIWFYLLPLSIVSNVFFPIGVFMNERFIFISSIGFCIFIGWLIYHYIPKLVRNEKAASGLMIALLLVIVGLYAYKTIDRNRAWENNLTLFTTDVKVSANSAKGNHAAGTTLLKEAVYNPDADRSALCTEAIGYLQRAIEIYPNYISAITEMADACYDCRQDMAATLSYYAKALSIKNNQMFRIRAKVAEMLNNVPALIGNGFSSSSPQDVINAVDQLIKAQPDFGEAYYLKGVLYAQHLNRPDLSLENMEKANTLNFNKGFSFYKDLGSAYGMNGQYEKAIVPLLKAQELAPGDVQNCMTIAMTYRLMGDMNNAVKYQQMANEMTQKQKIND